MVDASKLGKWIQPQHLDEENLARYRDSFARHPAQLVVVENFLLEDVAERISRFLQGEALFRREHGLYSIEGAVPQEDWESAEDDDRLFRLSRLEGSLPEHLMSPNAVTYLRLRQSLQQPEFREFFEALTGLELGSSDDFGVHSMSVGDFLRAHSDDLRNRSIAFVMYLSPRLEPIVRREPPDGRSDRRREPDRSDVQQHRGVRRASRERAPGGSHRGGCRRHPQTHDRGVVPEAVGWR